MADATLDQVGFETAGGAFDEVSTLVLPADGTAGAGYRFVGLPTRHAGEDYEETDRLYDGFSFTPGDLSVAVTGTLTIAMVEETTPARFSTSRLPSTLSTTAVATVSLENSTTIGTVSLDVGPLTQRYRRGGWTGTLAFVMTFVASGGLAQIPRSNALAATLTADDRELDSGVTGSRWWGSRILEDAKTGELVREDGTVEDPLTHARVAPENADPPEERRRRPRSRPTPRVR